MAQQFPARVRDDVRDEFLPPFDVARRYFVEPGFFAMRSVEYIQAEDSLGSDRDRELAEASFLWRLKELGSVLDDGLFR